MQGGDYWQDLIKRKNRTSISTKEAEKLFAEEYCKKLRQHYNYVLSMPLRIRRGHPPKYRMIHATNHVVGCLLMVDNICDRWQLMKDIQNNGQALLWEETYNNETMDVDKLTRKLVEHISNFTSFYRLNHVLADFFMLHGPICKTTQIKSIYKELEKKRQLEVKRTPLYTETGNPSNFFADEKKKTTEIRWKSWSI